jgi:hypothetical protein
MVYMLWDDFAVVMMPNFWCTQHRRSLAAWSVFSAHPYTSRPARTFCLFPNRREVSRLKNDSLRVQEGTGRPLGYTFQD